jgi:hypothetical protein
MKVMQANLKYTSPLVPLNPDKVLFLVIHHPDAVAATPEQIHQWHLQNGWAGAGYNEYIRKDGTVYIMRGDNIGAQCANMNSKSYGICCEGNYDIEPNMPQAQFETLVERIKYHKGRFNNLIEVGPHSKYVRTSCPGKNFPLDKVLTAVSGAMKVSEAIDVLQKNGIMSSSDYWLKNAVPGGIIKGDFAGKLLVNMANKLKG